MPNREPWQNDPGTAKGQLHRANPDTEQRKCQNHLSPAFLFSLLLFSISQLLAFDFSTEDSGLLCTCMHSKGKNTDKK